MKHLGRIFEKYIEWIILTLLTSLSFITAKAVHDLIFLPLLSVKKGEQLSLIASILLGLFLFFFVYSLYLQFFKGKNKSKKYDFDENTGMYFNKKTGKKFCASCMIKNIEAPLKTMSYGWLCLNTDCKTYYDDPNNPRPANRPIAKIKTANPYTEQKRW